MTPATSATRAPDPVPSDAGQLVELALDRVEPNPHQVRRNAEREKPDEANEQATIADLAAAIRVQGLIQPILVIPHPEPGKEGRFQIVSGERRYRAVQMLGWPTIRAVVDPALAQDAWRRKAIELSENTHRRALDWFDKARRLAELARDRPDLTQRDLSQQLGIPAARFSMYLAIGNPELDPVTLAAIQVGLFTEIHGAYLFLNLPAARRTALLSSAQRKLDAGTALKDIQLSRRRLEAFKEAAEKEGRPKAEAAPSVPKITLPALPEPLVRRLFDRLGLEFPDNAPGQVGARLLATLSEPGRPS